MADERRERASHPSASVATCPSCGVRVNVPAAAVGKRLRCRQCGQVFAPTVETVPAVEESPAASPFDFTGGQANGPEVSLDFSDNPEQVEQRRQRQRAVAPGVWWLRLAGSLYSCLAGIILLRSLIMAAQARAGFVIAVLLVAGFVAAGLVLAFGLFLRESGNVLSRGERRPGRLIVTNVLALLFGLLATLVALGTFVAAVQLFLFLRGGGGGDEGAGTVLLRLGAALLYLGVGTCSFIAGVKGFLGLPKVAEEDRASEDSAPRRHRDRYAPGSSKRSRRV